MHQIGRETDPERARRQRWAHLLSEHMRVRGMSQKDMRHALAEGGVNVSQQTISNWLTGTHAPRVAHQVAIARALEAPHAALFPVEVAA